MKVDLLFLRQTVVFASALIYWTGVLILARSLRKRTGKSANTRPKSLKEKILGAGWTLVIAGWIGQPFLINSSTMFSFLNGASYPFLIFPASLLILCGHSGTLWCYKSLGDSWRIWINKKEQTTLIKHGPYQFVRHPIYSFQIALLSGAALFLPTPFSILLLAVHFICILIKAEDEEAYLKTVHKAEYRSYMLQTNRFLPQLKALQAILLKKTL